MNNTELEGILTFIKEAENLKNTLRFAFTSKGRQESSAEHTWRLCLLLLVCACRLPHLHLEKLLKLAVIHDLAEAVCGDTPAISRTDHAAKTALERRALTRLLRPLSGRLKEQILDLWEEYESAATEEARCVKAFDKLETLVQHNQGVNPPGFDYAFNLEYGIAATAEINVASQLRKLIDSDTKKHIR